MSADTQSDGQGGAGRREVAYRLFATEFDDSTVSHSDSDEERAPNYVITPTGARVNRLFVVGVLTEVESVSEDVLRARVVDPTGAFVIYAGQYQPDPMTVLERADPPTFVAVTGKARTYQPEDSDRIFTSIRPESINEVDSDTRDRWTVQTAEQTIERIETFIASRDRPETGSDLEQALLADGVDVGLAAGIPLAMEKYGTTDAYLAALHDLAIDAVRVVANEKEEVPPLELAPDEGGTEPVEIDTGSVDVPNETATTASSTATESPIESGSTETEEGTTAEQSSTATEPDAGTDPEPEPTAATAETESSTGTTTDESSEPTTMTDDGGDSGTDDLGDFDDFTDTSTGSASESASTTESAVETEAEADLDVASDEMYEFDEEEREEIEEEYGTEFATGTEVDEPGEADIDTPSPESDESTAATTEMESEAADTEEPVTDDDETTDIEAATADSTEDETPDDETVDATAEPDGEPAEANTKAEEETDTDAEGDEETEAVVLDDAVIDVMAELDDGDGADREELIETMSNRHGIEAADVEDAIQDALMSGQCYEPDEGKLKAI